MKTSRQELRKWRTLWADFLLEKSRNTKHLQKINIDPIKRKACPIDDDDDFADFLQTLYAAPSEETQREWNYDLSIIPPFSIIDLEKALINYRT